MSAETQELMSGVQHDLERCETELRSVRWPILADQVLILTCVVFGAWLVGAWLDTGDNARLTFAVFDGVLALLMSAKLASEIRVREGLTLRCKALRTTLNSMQWVVQEAGQ